VKPRHGSGNGFDLNSGGSTVNYADGHAKFHTASSIYFRLGVNPEAVRPGDALFYDGASDVICVGGIRVGP
jgi:prepilin-type processing-associated H-X9-DG protein